MKEKDGFIDCPEQQVILYVEKEDGRYGPMQTGSYITKNFVDDFFLKRKSLERSLRDQVIRGEISPIRYYMILEDLTISELASRVRLSLRKVKQHLDPEKFGNASAEELKRYAVAFNVSIPNFFQIILIRTGETYESHTILENQAKNISIEQIPTNNSFVVLTNVEEREK